VRSRRNNNQLALAKIGFVLFATLCLMLYIAIKEDEPDSFYEPAGSYSSTGGNSTFQTHINEVIREEVRNSINEQMRVQRPTMMGR